MDVKWIDKTVLGIKKKTFKNLLSFMYILSSSFIGNTLNGKDVVELLKFNHLKLTLCHPKMKIWCWKWK